MNKQSVLVAAIVGAGIAIYLVYRKKQQTRFTVNVPEPQLQEVNVDEDLVKMPNFRV